ncbi:MAG: cysteine peptidase family C39 domain-containing protein [Candidatus Ratteibacteria bacterium]
MKKILIIVVVFFFNLVIKIYSQQDSLCGIKSLLVVYKLFGINPDYKEMTYLIKKYPNGMSMYALYKILNRRGLYVEGIKMSLKELSQVNLPAICYFYPRKEIHQSYY